MTVFFVVAQPTESARSFRVTKIKNRQADDSLRSPQEPVLLAIFFQQFFLVLRRLLALVRNDARGGRRPGQFASAAARLASCGEFLSFALALGHGIRKETSGNQVGSVPSPPGKKRGEMSAAVTVPIRHTFSN